MAQGSEWMGVTRAEFRHEIGRREAHAEQLRAQVAELQAEVERLEVERRDIVAEIKTLQAFYEVMHPIAAMPAADQPAERAPGDSDGQPSTGPAGAGPAGEASPGSGRFGGTRDMVFDVVCALGPGQDISSREIHEVLASEHGYTASVEAVRRAAQRLFDAGVLAKGAPSRWYVPDKWGRPGA